MIKEYDTPIGTMRIYEDEKDEIRLVQDGKTMIILKRISKEGWVIFGRIKEKHENDI